MKTWQIILVVFLGLILISLVAYGVVVGKVNKPGGTTTDNTPSSNGTNSGSSSSSNNNSIFTNIPKEDIEALAKKWEVGFRIPSGNRCNVIKQAHSLTDNDLDYFSNYYMSQFSEHPYYPMERANYWCFWGVKDNELFERFKLQFA